MREKYVVLRTKELLAPTIERVGAAAPRMRRAGDAPQTIELSESQLSQAERADLRRDPRTQAIALSMPMKLIKPVADAEPSNETGSSTWGLAAVGADSSPFSGQGVNVAVLDTGIDAGHPAFAGVPMVQRNFTAESSDDTNGHGTHCAGTIFGQDVNGLRIGVARGINKAIIGKVLGAGGGGSAEIAQAINWAAAEGAHIISMSLGIDFPGYVNRLVGQSLPIQAATSLALEGYRANINLFTQLARLLEANAAFGTGSLLIGAAGNESNRPEYEIAVAPPAAGTGVISVGALGQAGGVLSTANFSNDQVDVCAPGVDIVSAFPGGDLVSLSGTSMATPHVAGIAALWASRQMALGGGFSLTALRAQVVASGVLGGIDPSEEADNIGTGIVQAPQ